MKKFDNLDKFVECIKENSEVIIFQAGWRGKILLDYFKYNKLLPYISCIAVEKIFPPNNPNVVDHFLPVIPLENLIHFKDTALFVVAVPDEHIERFCNTLKEFEYNNIVIFTEKEMKQAQSVLKKLVKVGDVLSWKINNITSELEKLKLIVSEQNEVSAINTKAFSEYRNAFRDKKVVIVATGPTLKYYKPFPDAIHIGLNFAWRNENIPLDYLFTHDSYINVINEIKVDQGFKKIKNSVFIGRVSYNDACSTYAEDYFLNEKVRRFCIAERLVNQIIYQDICYHPVMEFQTVSFTALHFALFTYPKEIYLVGLDTVPSGHFYDQKNSENKFSNNDMASSVIKTGYARMKMFAGQYYSDTEIISINPVGLKGLFKDVYTDEYKNFLSNNG